VNRRRALVATFFATLSACGGEPAPAADSLSGSASRSTSTATPAARAADSALPAPPPVAAAAGAGCVSEGQWQACSVEKRLTDAGFVPVKKGAAPTGVFDVEGVTYALGTAELNVYLFQTAREREAAIAEIDTTTVMRRSGQSPWSTQPALITSNNLVAVLLSDNGRLIERVQNALTAGLPSATR
jgi:hypothetical protein